MEPSFAAKLPGWFHGFFWGMAGSKHDEPTHMKIIGLNVQLCELPPEQVKLLGWKDWTGYQSAEHPSCEDDRSSEHAEKTLCSSTARLVQTSWSIGKYLEHCV